MATILILTKINLGGGVVFSMNSKRKCTYQSQEQKKTWANWLVFSVWESKPVLVHTSRFLYPFHSGHVYCRYTNGDLEGWMWEDFCVVG